MVLSQIENFTLGPYSHPGRQESDVGSALDMLFSCARETRLVDLPGRSSGPAEVEYLKQCVMSHAWLHRSFYLPTAACDFPHPVVSQMLTVPTTAFISLQQMLEGLVGRG